MAICGSTRARSANLSIIEYIGSLLKTELDFEIYEQLSELPHFNPDLDGDQLPAAVEVVRKKIGEAQHGGSGDSWQSGSSVVVLPQLRSFFGNKSEITVSMANNSVASMRSMRIQGRCRLMGNVYPKPRPTAANPSR